MVPEKNGPWKNGPREKWCPEKFPAKIVLRQKNARKFKRLFHFYQLIPLHTQKNVWGLRHDPTYVPNCRTLKESGKICCRVLGFHRLITSEHSTHTHTPRCSTLAPRFFVSGFSFVSEFCVCCPVLGFHRLITSQHSTHTTMLDAHPTIFRFWVPRGPIFRGPFFPGGHFSGDNFSGDHFSEMEKNYIDRSRVNVTLHTTLLFVYLLSVNCTQ